MESVSSTSTEERNDHRRERKEKKKRTQRNRVVKLELSNDVERAIRKTAEVLYEIKDDDINIDAKRAGETGIRLKPAKNPSTWVQSDALFNDAKRAYDGILQPFLQEPQVYKLESTKNKLHKQSYDPSVKDPHLERIEEYLAKEDAKLNETTLTTYIDPFSLPHPWEKITTSHGKVAYFNPETFERLNEPTQLVWEKKMEELAKLKRRDDLNGYEYKEAPKEKRFRVMTQDDFDKRLQNKLERRREDPTPLEQVEDCLYSIIDTIDKADIAKKRKEKKEYLKKLRAPWTPVTRGFRMKPLKRAYGDDNDDDEEEEEGVLPLVTDLEFIDNIISKTDMVLPVTMPYNLLEIHEEEREKVRQIEREKEALEELERSRPIGEKMLKHYKDLRNNPRSQFKKYASSLKSNIKKLPELISTKGKKGLILGNKLLVQGWDAAKKAAKDPGPLLKSIREGGRQFLESMTTKSGELDLDAVLEDIAGDHVAELEEEAKRKAHEEWLRTRSKKPIPVSHPDVVIVKIVITTHPPPRFVRRPPDKTKMDILQEELAKHTKKIAKQLPVVGMPLPQIGGGKKPPADLFCPHGREWGKCDECDEENDNADDGSGSRSRFSHHSGSSVDIVEEEREIFDTSIWDEFENGLKKQIAEAVHIPVRAITFEDIKKFPDNEPRVTECRVRNEAIIAEKFEVKMRKLKAAEDEFYAKVDEIDKKLTIKLPKLLRGKEEEKSVNEEEVEMKVKVDVGVENDSNEIIIPPNAPNVAVMSEEANDSVEVASMSDDENGIETYHENIDHRQASTRGRKMAISFESKELLDLREKLSKFGLEAAIEISTEINAEKDNNSDSEEDASLAGESITSSEMTDSKAVKILRRISVTPDMSRRFTMMLSETYGTKGELDLNDILEEEEDEDSDDSNSREEEEVEKGDSSNNVNGLVKEGNPKVTFALDEGNNLHEDGCDASTQKKEPTSPKPAPESPCGDAAQPDSEHKLLKAITTKYDRGDKLQKLLGKFGLGAMLKPAETWQDRYERIEEVYNYGKNVSDVVINKNLKEIVDFIVDEAVYNNFGDMLGPIFFIKKYDPPQLGSIKEDDEDEDSENPFEGQEGLQPNPKGIQPKFEHYTPQMPKYLIPGLQNIDALNRDPNFWQSKFFKKLDEDQLRNRRVIYLSQIRKEEGLMKVFRELEEKKKNVLLDIEDFVEPATDVLLPFVYAIGRKAKRNYRKLKTYLLPEKEPEPEEVIEPIPDDILDLMEDMILEVEVRIEEEEAEGRLNYYDVIISKVECTSLINVELMGENDPYVLFRYKEWEQKTPYIDGAGDSASWDELNYVFESSNVSLEVNEMIIEVYDQNDMRTDTFIGSTSVDLSQCIDDMWLGKDYVFSVGLLNKKKKPSGMVTVTVNVDLKGTSADKLEERLRADVTELLDTMVGAIEADAALDAKNRPEVEACMERIHKAIEYRFLSPTEKAVLAVVPASRVEKNAKTIREINKVAENLYAAIDQDNEQEADVFFSLLTSHRENIYPEPVVYLMDKITTAIAYDDEYEISSDEEDSDEDSEEESEEEEEDEEEEDEEGEGEESEIEEGNEVENDVDNDDEVAVESKSDDSFRDGEKVDGELVERDEEKSDVTSKEKLEEDDDDDDDDDDDVDYAGNLGGASKADSSDVSSDVSSSESGSTSNSKGEEGKEEGEEDPRDPVQSCEISLKILAPNEMRTLPGLRDLKATDIAFYLREQLTEIDSNLSKGSLTSKIVDVSFEDNHARRQFETWENYWAYVISPVFFGYSASKIRKNDPLNKGKEDDGLKFVNPVSKYTERTKEAWFALTGGKPEKRLGKRALEKSIVDLNVDEFAGEELLKIFRPNMQDLHKRDIDKCKRVWKAFEDQYELEMKAGLVDGKRLRNTQFEAMKMRDSAFRVYRTARQRYGRENLVESNEPVLETTHITDELYSGWMKEVKVEEDQILKEERLKKIEQKALRIQEAETRMKYTQNKNFILNKIIMLYEAPRDFSKTMEEEVQKDYVERLHARSSEATEAQKGKALIREKMQKEALITAEKQTRLLFDQYMSWIESNKDGEPKKNRRKTMNKKKVEDEASSSVLTTKDALVNYLRRAKDQLDDEKERAKEIKKLKEHLVTKQAEARRLAKLQEALDKARGVVLEQLKDRVGKEMDDLSTAQTEESVEDVEALIEEAGKPRVKNFTTNQMEIFRHSNWIVTILDNSDHFQSLVEFPTKTPEMLAKDELSQFAVITTEVSPMVARVKHIIEMRKEEDAKAKGLKSERDKRKQALKMARQNPDDEVNDDLADADLSPRSLALKNESRKRAQKQLIAAKRRRRREEEWAMAHQHLFISIPGEAPFCVACKEVRYRLWNLRHMKAEKEWLSTFDDFLQEKLEEGNNTLYDPCYKYTTGMEAAEKLIKEVEERSEPSAVKIINQIVEIIELEAKEIIFNENSERPGKWIHGIRIPKYLPIIPENIPESLIRTGHSLIDCNGANVLGKDANDLVPIELPPDRPITPEVFGITPTLMIRMWNRIDGEQKEFLGRVIVPAEELLNPEAGIRAYNLEVDPTIQKMQDNEKRRQDAIEAHKMKEKKVSAFKKAAEPFEIQGKLFLRISAPKSDEDDIPIQWRVEIVKASKIACVHNAQKSSPYCEILWRGPAERDGDTYQVDDWLELGFTKTKERTLDPQWKRDDWGIYEFPPYWTVYDVENRGLGGEPLTGGAWVGRNLIPKDDPAAKKNKLSALDRIRMETKAAKDAAEAVVLQRRQNNDENLADAFVKDTPEEIERARIDALVKQEVTIRLESYKFCLQAEETERKAMTIEDDLVRRNIIDAELLRTKKYVDKQVVFSRQYARIVYNVIDAPLLLNRVQFCSGYMLNNGGTKVMCQDPATRMMLEVIAIPLLYEDDENELKSQITFLLGKVHPNLIKFIDYSVHQVRKFTFTGYTSASERVALVITDCALGPVFGTYIKLNWGPLTNHQFRVFLMQILSGFMSLHRDGIIHRNVHPECVKVQMPEEEDMFEAHRKEDEKTENKQVEEEEEEDDDENQDDNNSRKEKDDNKRKVKKFKNKNPVCKLTDYWFLQNPRKVGCKYSMGRADWGFAHTAAPEVQVGAQLSVETDIWAFGICVFYWATKGLYPNFNTDSLEDLRVHIPMKWGDWVHALLRMCLQPNKDYRASAEEMYNFLAILKLEGQPK